MALAVDSFQNVIDLFQKDFDAKCGAIMKGLAIVGMVYVTKKVIQSALYCYADLKCYGIAKLWKTSLHKYGSWAVVTGCEDIVNIEFAKELARNGINLVLIGSNQCIPINIHGLANVQVEQVLFDYKNFDRSVENINSSLIDKDIGIFVCSTNFTRVTDTTLHNMTYEELTKLTRINVEFSTQMYRMVIARMIQKNNGIIMTIISSYCEPPNIGSAWKAYISTLLCQLKNKYKNSRIEFLNLIPQRGLTHKTYSWKVLEMFEPSPESYAKSALTTVGWTPQTSGHFSHQLQLRLFSVADAVKRMFIFRMF